MLSISSATKRFGSLTALDGVSFEIKAGEFFGLLGPNGAGKSTLMSLIAGLRAADAGEISIDGKLVSTASEETRRNLGLVPQSIALYPDLSARENLELFGKLSGLRGELLSERIDEALTAAQLTDRHRDLVKNFSGGMQRRLNLVAALLHRPRLLLCDEPTVGVDPQSRNAIFEYLERINREGTTIIYSTHYMEEAARLCSRIGIIDHGKLLAEGSLHDLLTQLPFEEEITFPAEPSTDSLADALRKKGRIITEETRHRFQPAANFPLSAFYSLTESQSLPARLFTAQRPSLEALFLHLTGRTLRE